MIWEPLAPPEVSRLFAGTPWLLAGGYALELAACRSWRPHGDIDVLLLRRDQLAVQRALAGWEWWAADPPGTLRPWRAGELLPLGVHVIWCRPRSDESWRIQVMLDESSGDDWVSRRDPRLRRRVESLRHNSSDGIPYLAPEVQLFYKAADPRPKDLDDFTHVLPVLTAGQRAWLRAAIVDTYGDCAWTDLQLVPLIRFLPSPRAPAAGRQSGASNENRQSIQGERVVLDAVQWCPGDQHSGDGGADHRG